MINTIIIALLLVCGCFSLDYSDLETLGAKCEGRDSCTRLSNPRDFFQRNCECDRLCSAFGDCCIDARAAMRYPNRLLHCMPFGTAPNQGAYVISECPRRGGPYVNDCLSTNMKDPLLQAPVSTPGGATYRNIYCAACHGVELAKLVPWPVLVNCESLAPYNLSDSFVWRNLELDDDFWVVRYDGQLHDCDVLFDKPDTVQNVRLCRADLVSTCADGWKRKKVRESCASYMAVVHTLNASYRNPHCAICNRETVRDIVCDSNELLQRRWKPFSFALLLDVNRNDGEIVGEQTCAEGQKYDPFNNKCRPLVCALKGYKMEGDKCVKV